MVHVPRRPAHAESSCAADARYRADSPVLQRRNPGTSMKRCLSSESVETLERKVLPRVPVTVGLGRSAPSQPGSVARGPCQARRRQTPSSLRRFVAPSSAVVRRIASPAPDPGPSANSPNPATMCQSPSISPARVPVLCSVMNTPGTESHLLRGSEPRGPARGFPTRVRSLSALRRSDRSRLFVPASLRACVPKLARRGGCLRAFFPPLRRSVASSLRR